MEKLPSRPSLEHLKKQAKDLLALARSGASTEVQDLVGAVPLRLAAAQLALARRYGFASWAKLAAFVESQNLAFRDAAAQFVQSALANDITRCQAILERFPDLPEVDPWCRLAYGGEALPHGLDPNLAGGPANLTPLVVCCFSGYLRRADRRAQVRRLAILLLETGADPNAFRELDDSWKTQETPLYGASGLSNDPELTAALLAHGASPDDGESLYHSSEHGPDNRCLRLILKAGPSPERVNYCVKRKLDFEDMDGLQAYIEHGVDLNAEDPLGPALRHALTRGRSLTILQALLDGGADPEMRDHFGLTAYQFAYRAGMLEAAEFLATHGAKPELREVDRIIGLAMAGQLDDPEALVGLPLEPRDQDAVWEAADRGRAPALAMLLRAGLDPNETVRFAAPPVHWAALHGFVDAVALLAEAGAKLDVREQAYKALPIGFACWGSLNERNPKGDYPATVATLIRHGSPFPDDLSGSPEVNEVIAAARGG